MAASSEGDENNFEQLLDQCETLRRSNLQLREEILRLERENAELKKQNLNFNLEDNKSGPTSIHISSISNNSTTQK